MAGMMKKDRLLIVVKFVTWAPASERTLGTGEKVAMMSRIWAPVVVDDDGRLMPDKLLPLEQGGPWAVREVVRVQPDGREVLAVLGWEETGILESSVVNQPSAGAANDLGLGTGRIVSA